MSAYKEEMLIWCVGPFKVGYAVLVLNFLI